MDVTPEVDRWLQDAGYAYQCFISWPRTINPDITDCARNLKESIEQWLALSFYEPKVFLDETAITGGDEWEETILDALCRSMTLVAVCAPMYYHPRHKWCGIEWASMEALNRIRLQGANFHAIIPVIVRHSERLPEAVKRIQYHDMSRLITCGRRYFATKAYREAVKSIGQRIEEIAVTLAGNQAEAECEHFAFADASAFADYQAQPQPMPFRKVNST